MTRTNPLRFPFRAHDPEPPSPRACIPLSSALLCVECSSVYQAEGAQVCPACGSKQAVALGRVLGRAAG